VTLLDTRSPLVVYDPNDGVDRRVELAEFEKNWDGFLLLLNTKGTNPGEVSGVPAGRLSHELPPEERGSQ
jgi:hypothetical protein